MFIKHGDGKINHIVESEELTEEQKKAMQKTSEEISKQADQHSKDKKVEN